jgi:solute carrier family 35, member E1
LNSVAETRGGGKEVAAKTSGGIDFPLLIYFALWYLGNYYYNITNKLCLNAAGGKTGFPMTIASLQLGVGSLYGLFLWLAPDARKKPTITKDDIIKMLPVGFCFMGAHAASVFAMGMGAVSFAQIVKASEPAFAAVLSQFVYGNKISKAKWWCLPIVIGGVILASVKELDFAWSALISACIANMFAAVRGNENKKLMETAGIKERIGSIGNQFALTSILGFLLSIPVVMAKEGSRFGEFCNIAKTSPAVWTNLVASALWFYGYNELATMTLKKTGAVTQSVANTAKRVIVIVGVALVLGESLDPIKLIGCSIGIGGVLLYSIIDKIVK